MPFVTPLFVYLQFVYKFVCFLDKKPLSRQNTEIAAIVLTFLRYFYLVALLYHNIFKMSTVWVNFGSLHKIKLTVLCK